MKRAICEEWSLAAFAEHFKFVHDSMHDHKYAWVLGAGASKSSGIPLGGQLVDQWLRELALRDDACDNEGNITSEHVEVWATGDRMRDLEIYKKHGNVPFSWDDRGAFYTQIYDARFRDNPDEGFAFLESVMANRDPSPGYSILATILAGVKSSEPDKKRDKADSKCEQLPRHNAVVTTNFDNLVADALSIYTDTFPFVCGHESLTGFVRVAMRRPLVCKIHRDLLLGPQNDTRSLRRLHDAWGAALRSLFEHYTPLFIGYGGNDDTLMDLLESFGPDEIKGQPVWCYYARDPYDAQRERPHARIQELMRQLNGVIVPVPDFDLLMILLGHRIGVELLDEEIECRAEKRVKDYRNAVEAIDTVKHPTVATALYGLFSRTGGEWAWSRKINTERDSDKKETLFKQALHQYPKSSVLLGDYATFQWKFRNAHDESERHFRRALEADPGDVINLGNYANFLRNIRGCYDEAEEHYKRAIDADPQHANSLGNYASFLNHIRGSHDEAEEYYKRAIEADPMHANILGNYATFLTDIRGLHDEAEEYYERAIEADPMHANNLSNYASYLNNIRGLHNEAEEYCKRAIDADTRNASNLGNYAEFLIARGRSEEAIKILLELSQVIGDQSNSDATMCVWLQAASELLLGLSAAESIDRLSRLLDARHHRLNWQCDDDTKERIETDLPPHDAAFLLTIAEAISDPEMEFDFDQLLKDRDVAAKKAAKTPRKRPARTKATKAPKKASLAKPRKKSRRKKS